MDRCRNIVLLGSILYSLVLLDCCFAYSTGVSDAARSRFLCKHFGGPIHPFDTTFNLSTMNLRTSFKRITGGSGLPSPPAAADCYENGHRYNLTISSDLTIQGLLMTVIEEKGKLDYFYDTVGSFALDRLYKLKPAVCKNSVSHKEKLQSTHVDVPWIAPEYGNETAQFVYMLVFSYHRYTPSKQTVLFPKCDKNKVTETMPQPSSTVVQPLLVEPTTSTAYGFFTDTVPQSSSTVLVEPTSSTAYGFFTDTVPQSSSTVLVEPTSSTAYGFFTDTVPQSSSTVLVEPTSSTAYGFFTDTVPSTVVPDSKMNSKDSESKHTKSERKD